MKKLNMQWLGGLSEKDAKELNAIALEAEVLLKRLEGLLQAKMDVARSEQLNKESFDSPSWAYKQAFSNGLQKAYEEVKTLIQLRD